MKAIELIKQNTYENKNKNNKIPEAFFTTKEKQLIKEEPIQKKRKNSVPERKQKLPEPDHADLVTTRIGAH